MWRPVFEQASQGDVTVSPQDVTFQGQSDQCTDEKSGIIYHNTQ